MALDDDDDPELEGELGLVLVEGEVALTQTVSEGMVASDDRVTSAHCY